MNRYVKQVAVAPMPGGDALIVVLCSNGRVWERDARTKSGWVLLPDLPQERLEFIPTGKEARNV